MTKREKESERRTVYVPSNRAFGAADPADRDVLVIVYDPADPPPEAPGGRAARARAAKAEAAKE